MVILEDIPQTTVCASMPLLSPPVWAVLQRRLIEELGRSIHVYLDAYTHHDGPRKDELIWGDSLPGRDGADDFYEAFYNWPLLYLLGGTDELLPLAHRQWEATTRQLARLGMNSKEYERGYDQFHQSEGNLFFYFLCLADPTNDTLSERARRFAGFYLNEAGLNEMTQTVGGNSDPASLNYDPEINIIRAPHNGSDGPRPGLSDGEPEPYEYSSGMANYGLPYFDLPGIDSFEDLRDVVKARQMGISMQQRMGRGDAAVNLGVCSLVANAWLLTHDEKYKKWVLRYVDGWIDRAEANHGLLPDNVGLTGRVGEYLNGCWYGGLYGWTWPHGFYNLQAAALVASQCCMLLTNNVRYLQLAREQQEFILGLGTYRTFDDEPMSLKNHWIGQRCGLDQRNSSADRPMDAEANLKTFLVPYRFNGTEWFDYQPLSPIYPAALWNMSAAVCDWETIQRLRQRESYSWLDTHGFRTKEDAGHEQPWLEFLAGRNPGYPENALRAAFGQVIWRLDRIRTDDADLIKVNIHHWQERNPVTTEALVQLTLGAPQHIYNGGLLVAPVRHFDADRKRPGLPPDVAALVTQVAADSISLTFVNLNVTEVRTVLMQAGSFGEHEFTVANYVAQSSDSPYPATITHYEYAPGEVLLPRPMPVEQTVAVNGRFLRVRLPAGTEITLRVGMRRYVNQASYKDPFQS